MTRIEPSSPRPCTWVPPHGACGRCRPAARAPTRGDCRARVGGRRPRRFRRRRPGRQVRLTASVNAGNFSSARPPGSNPPRRRLRPRPVPVDRAVGLDARRGDGRLVEVRVTEAVQPRRLAPAAGERGVEGQRRQVATGVPGRQGGATGRIDGQCHLVTLRRRHDARVHDMHHHEGPTGLAARHRDGVADVQHRPVGGAHQAVPHGDARPAAADAAQVRTLIGPAGIDGVERGAIGQHQGLAVAGRHRLHHRSIGQRPGRKTDRGVRVR